MVLERIHALRSLVVQQIIVNSALFEFFLAFLACANRNTLLLPPLKFFELRDNVIYIDFFLETTLHFCTFGPRSLHRRMLLRGLRSVVRIVLELLHLTTELLCLKLLLFKLPPEVL